MTSNKEKNEVPIVELEIPVLSLRDRLSHWLRHLDKFMPFVLIIACAVVARFIDSEVLVLAVFITTLGIYAWRKYDLRIPVGTAILLLVVCAVLLAEGIESFANDVAIWAYYFLVVGVLGLFIEYLRESHED